MKIKLHELLIILISGIIILKNLELEAKRRFNIPQPLHLKVKGFGEAAYYKPLHFKRRKPVFVYLHSKNGNPFQDCKKWYRAAVEYGWIVCPSGIRSKSGRFSWNNNPFLGKKIVEATLKALSKKYKRKVLLRRGILVGFSEGAFIALQLAFKMYKIFPYIIVIGADTKYVGYNDVKKLKKLNRRLRIYLITGEKDIVLNRSKNLLKLLRKNRIASKLRIVRGVGHKIPKNITPIIWRAIRWLTKNPNYPIGRKKKIKKRRGSITNRG